MIQHCLVCNDARKYQTAVHEVNNIVRRINLLKKKNLIFTHEMKRFQSSLNFDKKHIHFMCGHCLKINENDLRNAETYLDEAITQVVFQMDNEHTKYELLQCLSGHYPGKYKQVERYVLEKEYKC